MPFPVVRLVTDRVEFVHLRFGVAAVALSSLLLPAFALAEPAEPQQPSGSPEPYVDRLIDGGNLQALASQSEQRPTNSKGNVRSLTVEMSASQISPKSQISGVDTSGADRSLNEIGISVSGRYQTDNYGLLGIDAELRRGTDSHSVGSQYSNSTNGSITLTSRDLPLGNGWIADGAAGMETAPSIPLVRKQSRFYLPTSPLLGGTVTLKRYDRIGKLATSADPQPVATFNLSAGEPGLLGGLRVAEFSGIGGLIVSGGGQVELSPKFAAGIQVTGVENARDPYSIIFQNTSTSNASVGKISSQAAMGSASYSGRGLRLQANAIWSHFSGQAIVSSAEGGWLDASYRSGRTSHSGGVYYFGPDLSWGTSAIINNAYGAYYRYSSSTQRWRWTLSLDAVDLVNGLSSSGIIVNADIRKQLTFKTSIGANATVRVANGQTASQILGFVDFSNRWGSTRAEVSWSHDPNSDLLHTGWNQAWALPSWLPSGSRLSTQLAFDHRRQLEESPYNVGQNLIGQSNSLGAGISAGATPFSGISFDATITFNTNASAASASTYGPADTTGGSLGILSSQLGQAFSANIAATARLSSNWSLSASFTDTRSNLLSRYALSGLPSSPLGYTPAELAAAQKSSFRLVAGYLTLRYSVSAGRPKGAYGRREFPVGGTGILAGHVYLDGNANRQREPMESGVAGIVIVLDGIQAVKTDQSGYYRFEGVADGRHRVTVNADALPLPWSIVSDDTAGSSNDYAATVEIGVRATTTLDIAGSR